ncbi:unnamed protein product, partial [Effrenium voratum]
ATLLLGQEVPTDTKQLGQEPVPSLAPTGTTQKESPPSLAPAGRRKQTKKEISRCLFPETTDSAPNAVAPENPGRAVAEGPARAVMKRPAGAGNSAPEKDAKKKTKKTTDQVLDAAIEPVSDKEVDGVKHGPEPPPGLMPANLPATFAGRKAPTSPGLALIWTTLRVVWYTHCPAESRSEGLARSLYAHVKKTVPKTPEVLEIEAAAHKYLMEHVSKKNW